MSQAKTATIELSKSGSDKITYNNCPVVMVHDKIDIALISLPDSAVFTNGLKLADTIPEEGTEVFSAGFPGLSNTPMWQLGKGITSNSAIDIEDFSHGLPLFIIQHTAQVSSGNSGGPLMIKDENFWQINIFPKSSALKRRLKSISIKSDYQNKYQEIIILSADDNSLKINFTNEVPTSQTLSIDEEKLFEE